MTTTIATPTGAGVLATGSERNLGTWQDSLRTTWEKFQAYRVSIAELKALTDRQLADMGIARSAISQHARAAVYGQ